MRNITVFSFGLEPVRIKTNLKSNKALIMNDELNSIFDLYLYLERILLAIKIYNIVLQYVQSFLCVTILKLPTFTDQC